MTEKKNENTKLAIVAKIIDEFQIVINKGQLDGISKNDRYLIYSIGNDIIDPITKESLGKLEIVRGTGKVIHVQEKIATIESDQLQQPTKTIRKITRKPKGAIAISFGGGLTETETVEEQDGYPEKIPFDYPSIGDRAKPI